MEGRQRAAGGAWPRRNRPSRIRGSRDQRALDGHRLGLADHVPVRGDAQEVARETLLEAAVETPRLGRRWKWCGGVENEAAYAGAHAALGLEPEAPAPREQRRELGEMAPVEGRPPEERQRTGVATDALVPAYAGELGPDGAPVQQEGAAVELQAEDARNSGAG